jgi:FAD/FMN-containing dehydrogenase
METPLKDEVIQQLRSHVRGTVILPTENGYDQARKIWNGVIDKKPALIVQCSGTADVIAAVNFARDNTLPLAVRGGGHNVAGNAMCDDGVVIDLSPMRRVRIDPVNKTARVDGGAKLGDVDHEAQAFGLAVPVGVVSATGIAGLSLHGGMGFLTRKYGLTCDHLLSADVVTADGKIVVADAKNNADLLWALRGGGGSFGVVTSFEFTLRPVGPEVWMGIVMYPVAEAKKVLQVWREFMETAPDEISSIAIYWSAPHEEPVPKEHHGAPVIVLAACWCGPMDKGEAALKPLREVTTPVVDLSGPMPYLVAQKLFDPEYPNGRRYYWKSIYMKELGDNAIDMLSGYAAKRPSPISSIDVWCLGGAMARVKPEQSAFFKRDAPYLLGVESNWDDPKADEANITWTRNLYKDAEKYSPGGMYFNFPGFMEEGDDMLKQSFGTNYDKLRQVKAKYDPQNLFTSNLKIPGKA